MGKPFWKSKTLWFNAAGAIVPVFWNDIKPLVSPEHAIQIITIVNILLRYVTTEPVALK